MYVCEFLDLDRWQSGCVLQSEQNHNPRKTRHKVLKEGFEE
jgi:hypothetical protein